MEHFLEGVLLQGTVRNMPSPIMFECINEALICFQPWTVSTFIIVSGSVSLQAILLTTIVLTVMVGKG